MTTEAIFHSGSNFQPTNIDRANGSRLTFPPFPQPPQGVHIVPFVEFNERGISTNPGPDEVEVDTIGIPTVVMRVAHSTDVRKTNTKRKRQSENKARDKPKPRQPQWWEVWEGTEAIKFTKSIDPRSSRLEKIQVAIIDFTKDRTWPPQVKSETGPKFLWEKFLRFIGLPEGYLPISDQIQSKKKKRQAQEDYSMQWDDLDDDDIKLPEVPINDQAGGQNLAPITHNRVLTNEDKLHMFLENPVEAISVFMTSHLWNKGYIWSEDNLSHLPRLLDFLIRFLLRSKVFPDLECEYRRALEITKEGLVQLPNSAAFMKAIPDKLADGCIGCWGRKAVSYKFVDMRLDSSSATLTPVESKVQSKPERTKAQSGGDLVDKGGWGGGDSNWGDWGDVDIDNVNAWANDQLEQMVVESDMKPHPLLGILGPTAFPLTHTTGVVERSMRRVRSIQRANNNSTKAPGRPEDGPDPAAVEIDLDRCFSKIVLAPMPDWDNGEAPVYSSPSIMESSRGPVVGDGVSAKGSGLKPHDPKNDDITLLIEKRNAKLLCEGMGVGGTWVQIVRQDAQVINKKGKAEKPDVYWYLEDVAFVIPSFWSFYG